MRFPNGDQPSGRFRNEKEGAEKKQNTGHQSIKRGEFNFKLEVNFLKTLNWPEDTED
jgi:hypothetical protein